MKNNNWLLYFILTGVVLGGICGWWFGPQMEAVAWMGDIFLDALLMLVIPLIVSSLIVGISGLGDITKVGKTGVITLLYFMATTAFSVIIGLCMVNLLTPGESLEMVSKSPKGVISEEPPGVTDLLQSFISPNLIESMLKMDILPIIVFSLVFGGVLTTLGEKGKGVISFFDTVNEAIMKMVHLVLYYAPIGVFALVASKLGAVGGGDAFWAELMKLGKFVFTVLAALLFHALIVLPGILWFFGRRNPIKYFRGVTAALTTAFSTASSSATLPVTIECAEENNGVSRRASLFVLPIGATVNMDGTAMYEAIAAIFIAQMIGVPLGMTEQITIFVTATLAAIGAAGIPEAGLVTLVMVVQSVGLPIEGIGMLLSIDWFLDRCRTTINVWGDSIGAAVVDKLEEQYVEGG